MKVGDAVEAKKMAESSFYKRVIGTVSQIKGDVVSINATFVMSKWDKAFKKHPNGYCATSANINDIVVLG